MFFSQCENFFTFAKCEHFFSFEKCEQNKILEYSKEILFCANFWGTEYFVAWGTEYFVRISRTK